MAKTDLALLKIVKDHPELAEIYAEEIDEPFSSFINLPRMPIIEDR